MHNIKPLMLDMIRAFVPMKRLIEQFILPFEKAGFLQVQVIAMFTLKELGAVNMSTLAKKIGYSNQRLTNPIYDLVKQGMVIRRDDNRNRRIVLVELSETGRVKLDELTEAALASLAGKFDGLDSEEMARLTECFRSGNELLAKIKN